jgi:4-amino-4-deoxy-L-arabinose transferase-like glycosyltransferase
MRSVDLTDAAHGREPSRSPRRSDLVDRSGRRRTLLALLVLVLSAFASRTWQLDSQSLRGDEAFDVVFSRRPVSEILRELRTTQPYPPLYHLFLKGWMTVAGHSAFALRFPSVCCSVLCVPLLYILAKLWCDERTALWAAFLLTWQPLSIWYAQDGRMYAALMLFSLAALCFAVHLWKGRREAWIWAGFTATALLGVMTHYMAFLALLAQNVCALFVAWRDLDRRLALRWLAAQIAVGLICLPWVVFVYPLLRSHTSSWAEYVSLPTMLWRVLKACTVGLTGGSCWALGAAIASGAGLLLGVVALWRTRRRRVALLIVIIIFTPVALIALMSINRPVFDERYLIFLVAPILLLVGRGLSWLRERRWVQVMLATLVLGGMWSGFVHYRFDPAYAKSRPWRELFAYLETHIQQGDMVVYTFPDPAPEVYTDGRWPVTILPTASPPDESDLSNRVTQLATVYERIWLIPQWSPKWDGVGLVEDVLDRVCERAAELRVASWPLVIYHTPGRYKEEMMSLDAALGDRVRLLGYVLRDATGSAVHRLDLGPGDEARLTLYWQATTAVNEDYVVFVHLLDETGWLRGQQDNQPRQGSFSTKAWVPGEWVVDTYQVPIASDAPPGEYSIEVGMYRPVDGARLVAAGADADPEQRRVLLQQRVSVR